jgi:Ca2+-binding RTX toxin-like protein
MSMLVANPIRFHGSAGLKSREICMARINGTQLNDTLIGTPRRDHIFGFAGDDQLKGEGGNDFLDAGLGRDSVFGDGGNDRIVGGSHIVEIPGDDDDIIDGGAGQDWIIYSSLKEPVEIFLGDEAGLAVVNHPIADLQLQTDELFGIENAIGSPVGHSVLGGNSGDNILVGIGPKTNFLSSPGEDTYQIKGNGTAFFFFLEDPTGIVLDLPEKTLIDGYGDTDTLKLHGTVLVNGTPFDDVMLGTSRRDWFNGLSGEDDLHGNRGSDVITGGDGSDLIDGGRGSDWFISDRLRTLRSSWTSLPEQLLSATMSIPCSA